VEIEFHKLEQMLGHCFADRGLAIRALTHPSLQHEQSGEGDYQRLEFLGDAVLGMLLAEALYARFPGGSEGDLSRRRAQMAGQEALADIARRCGLGPFIQLGRGEELTDGRNKDSILSDVLESLIAAVYLDGGLEPARKLVTRLFEGLMDSPESIMASSDTKSALQELLSARRLPPPIYELVEESGPPHARLYRFQVLVGGDVAGDGQGRSKKIAQQAAAARALKRFADE
jgi:ribonuclease-3